MTSEFFIRRIKDNGKATIGLLYHWQEFLCFTLEDEFRETKISGETRIPAGRYKIEKCYTSGLLNRMRANGWYTFDWIPTIVGVPNFTNIRIHSGVHEGHTDGCPLLGYIADSNNFTIGDSRKAVLDFVSKLDTCFQSGDVFISIIDEVDRC